MIVATLAGRHAWAAAPIAPVPFREPGDGIVTLGTTKQLAPDHLEDKDSSSYVYTVVNSEGTNSSRYLFIVVFFMYFFMRLFCPDKR